MTLTDMDAYIQILHHDFKFAPVHSSWCGTLTGSYSMNGENLNLHPSFAALVQDEEAGSHESEGIVKATKAAKEVERQEDEEEAEEEGTTSEASEDAEEEVAEDEDEDVPPEIVVGSRLSMLLGLSLALGCGRSWHMKSGYFSSCPGWTENFWGDLANSLAQGGAILALSPADVSNLSERSYRREGEGIRWILLSKYEVKI